MQNGVPKAFRTPFLKSSKTKTKTKYLLLTFQPFRAFKDVGEKFQPIVRLVNTRGPQFLAERILKLITEQQARALAYLLHETRPDWGVQSLLSLIDKHKDAVKIGALTIAAMSKALEPSCKTPAPIFHPGPHWPVGARANLPKPEPCPDHIGEAAHNCRCCHADVKAGLRPAQMIGKHYTPQAIYDAMKASLEHQ